MMAKNKRGIGLEWYMLIVAIFLGFVFYGVGYAGEHKVIKNYIGQYQFSIINTANKAKSTLFYIDQSSKYSLQQSVYEFAQNGGFSEAVGDEGISFETNECGKFNGANIWYKLKKDEKGNIIKVSCFDEKLLTSSFENVFNKYLNEYLLSHPYNIPTNNYAYEIKDSLEIIGRAKEPLIFDILKDETKSAIKNPTEIKIPIEPKKTEDKKPPEEKLPDTKPPADAKDIKIQTADFQDFTATDLCQKGKKCRLSNGAYKLLSKSQEIAKQKGVSLEVTSAYRSIEEQEAIWKRNPNSKMVCPPSPKCPHLTGNVVDIHFKGKPFAMNSKDSELLLQIMSEAGWVRYATETWHFECCGTDRYNRAIALEKSTGKKVTVIV